MTGHEVELWLRKNYNLEVELSDMYNILCIITPADSKKETNILIEALKNLSDQFGKDKDDVKIDVKVPDIPILALTPRDAFYSETESIPLKEAAGRISAESIMIYPPGIPIFIPGEIITAENLIYIDDNLNSGLPVQGLEDDTLQQIKVIKELKPFR